MTVWWCAVLRAGPRYTTDKFSILDGSRHGGPIVRPVGGRAARQSSTRPGGVSCSSLDAAVRGGWQDKITLFEYGNTRIMSNGIKSGYYFGRMVCSQSKI